ncbi:hypothetical protein E4U42_005494 [Claviceps africana]|uniref:Uncharacterized protein n=1 Tax=Claviceps africana TaxID=83212 RepID=A0A8K0J6I6_9HYPO|nr:hypothetical protein E4U42_005494 [Claviceps africana]
MALVARTHGVKLEQRAQAARIVTLRPRDQLLRADRAILSGLAVGTKTYSRGQR